MKNFILLLYVLIVFSSCTGDGIGEKRKDTYMIEVTQYFIGGGRSGHVYFDAKKTKDHWKYSFHDSTEGYFDTYSCVYDDSILRKNTGIDSVQIEIYEK